MSYTYQVVYQLNKLIVEIWQGAHIQICDNFVLSDALINFYKYFIYDTESNIYETASASLWIRKIFLQSSIDEIKDGPFLLFALYKIVDDILKWCIAFLNCTREIIIIIKPLFQISVFTIAIFSHVNCYGDLTFTILIAGHLLLINK